jgi:hypothetical protein
LKRPIKIEKIWRDQVVYQAWNQCGGVVFLGTVYL